MPEVLVIRHAQSDYPKDRITDKGKTIASGKRKELAGYNIVTCSPKKRSIQTAMAIGYKKPRIDSRLLEYEDDDINAPTADGYVRLVHSKKWNELLNFGQQLLTAIVEYGQEEDGALMISHNAVMSATYRILTGEINPFENLSGFKLSFQSGKIESISKT